MLEKEYDIHSAEVWKWKLLIDSSEKNKDRNGASMKKLGRLYYIGLFFNNFLPGSVGGDVVRIYYLGKKTGVSTATTSVLFERITSGGALVGIVILSAFFMDDASPYLLSFYLNWDRFSFISIHLFLSVNGFSFALYLLLGQLEGYFACKSNCRL